MVCIILFQFAKSIFPDKHFDNIHHARGQMLFRLSMRKVLCTVMESFQLFVWISIEVLKSNHACYMKNSYKRRYHRVLVLWAVCHIYRQWTPPDLKYSMNRGEYPKKIMANDWFTVSVQIYWFSGQLLLRLILFWHITLIYYFVPSHIKISWLY